MRACQKKNHGSHKIFNRRRTTRIHGRRSCSSQLISVLDVWTQILDKKVSLDAVYLDFQKAFMINTIPHQRLLTKPKAYGVHGSVHAWINSFLSQRNERVGVFFVVFFCCFLLGPWSMMHLWQVY